MANVYLLYSKLEAGRPPRTDTLSYLMRVSAKAEEPLTPVFDLNGIEKETTAVVFAVTGGTAEGLKNLYEKAPSVKRWLILNEGKGNAFSASMQMVTFLKEQNASAWILSGDADRVGASLKEELHLSKVLDRFSRLHIGQIGAPSDWLISKGTDRAFFERLGMRFSDIPVSEVEAEYEKGGYPENIYTFALSAKGYDAEEMKKALDLYGAVRRVCQAHQLDALTIRCFDLLFSVHCAGCAAVSVLSAEGIYAGCEGDMPSLLSMILLSLAAERPAFMCNPSAMDIEKNEMIFAHCTLPLNMPDRFSLTTHFESDSSVGIRGEFDPCPITVFKLSADGKRWFVSDGELLENPSFPDYCRTQVRVRLDKPVGTFLTEPIGNHYLICRGHFADLMNRVCALLQKK